MINNHDKSAIRDAATIVVLRRRSGGPSVLMGQRGKKAAFMPDKFVFPGGAVDTADFGLPVENATSADTLRRLEHKADRRLAYPLLHAGIRELWEESGLVIGAQNARAPSADVPADWRGFFATGHFPAVGALDFVFRAITPPGRPRRFDARFFVAEATSIIGDPDDFSKASDELSHLQWVPLANARDLPLPFITEIVLSEIEDRVKAGDRSRPVPFFDNATEVSSFHMIA